MFIKNDSELKPSTQELITAFDSYFAGWHRERMGCRREPWGVAVTWVIELDGREIGRVSVGPLPRGGGFRISQASTAQGIERQLYGDVMDDLEWAVNVALGLREPGVRIKRRPEPPSKTQAQEQPPAIPTSPVHRKRWEVIADIIRPLVDDGITDFASLDSEVQRRYKGTPPRDTQLRQIIRAVTDGIL